MSTLRVFVPGFLPLFGDEFFQTKLCKTVGIWHGHGSQVGFFLVLVQKEKCFRNWGLVICGFTKRLKPREEQNGQEFAWFRSVFPIFFKRCGNSYT
jgi:hypothetical protein